MGKTLDALQHLQKLELELGALRKQEESKRRQVQVCKRQIDLANQDIANKQAESKRHEVELKKVELEMSSREESIRKHREALNKAKTNKEYAAILASINTEKADSSKFESRVLELMGQRDTLKAALDALVAERDKLQARMGESEGRLRTYLDQTQAQRERLSRERDEAGAAVPPALRASFERAAERHEGEAMGVVSRPHPKREEYVCGGCNMSVPLEQVNALRSRDEIQLCNICGRILCLES
jgi:predicted  nucleic acid-binding Zn-ribbon protein